MSAGTEQLNEIGISSFDPEIVRCRVLFLQIVFQISEGQLKIQTNS